VTPEALGERAEDEPLERVAVRVRPPVEERVTA
jgi:hypothetical protein